MTSFSVLHLSEPLLEFAGNGRHVDVRFGLTDYGPVDFSTERTKEVRLGVVGSAQTIGKLGDWPRRCEGRVPAKKSRQPNLSPAFPAARSWGRFGAVSKWATVTWARFPSRRSQGSSLKRMTTPQSPSPSRRSPMKSRTSWSKTGHRR
jgi:hypothetical protein